MATPPNTISQLALHGTFADPFCRCTHEADAPYADRFAGEVPDPADRGSFLGSLHNEPPYPCLDCSKEFQRRSEWIRHGSDVHQPELKRVCPHANCERLFAPGRLYRMIDHYTEGHNGQTGHPIDGYPVNPSVERIWACGFCVCCFETWKDLGNHIWADFKAGFQKQDWNPSVYIHSLLQHPAIHKHWQRLLESHGIEDEEVVRRLGWTGDTFQKLRQQLEWDGLHRPPGDVLAKKAFDTLLWPPCLADDREQPQFEGVAHNVDVRDTPTDDERVHRGVSIISTDFPGSENSDNFASSMMVMPPRGYLQPSIPTAADPYFGFAAMMKHDNPGSAGASGFAANPASPSIPSIAGQSPAQTNGSLDADLDLQFLLDYNFEQDVGLD